MADSFVRVPADDAGKRVDATSLDVGAATVYRQRIVIGDDSASAQFAVVTGGALTITGTVNVSATASVILAAGTANFGTLNNISRTVQVAVGTPFTVNNISATVAAVLGAGTANIGSINNISATVAAVLAAGTANIGTINDISATVTVAGVVGLTAGTAVIGDLNAISRTVQVAVGTPFTINNISATSIVAGNVNISATAAVTIASANFVTVRSLVGSLGDPSAGTALTVKTAFASITAASQTIVAAVATMRIRVLGYRLQAQGTTAARFNAGSSGANLSQLWSFQAREGTVVNAPPGGFEFQSSAGEGLTVAVSPTVTVDASVVYVEI